MKVHDITRAVALGEYLKNGEGLAKQERNRKNSYSKSRTHIQFESLFSRQKSVLVWEEAVSHSISVRVPLVLSKGHAGLASKSSWVCVSDVCIRKSG